MFISYRGSGQALTMPSTPLSFHDGNTRVSAMETSGTGRRISAQEAAASLAAVRDSQRRARRIGYPVWFWLATGLGLAAVPLYTGPRSAAGAWLPHPWVTALSLASLALLAGTAITVSVRTLPGARHCRVALANSGRELSRFLWPFLGYAVVLLAGGLTWDSALWSAPLAPLATAAAAFVAWSGLGMACTTFSVFRVRS